jgi:hypothetical protein
MAKPKESFEKRQRERARQQKRREKEMRRKEAKERKAGTPPRSEDEDPDIAGIRPGPQPLPEPWRR